MEVKKYLDNEIWVEPYTTSTGEANGIRFEVKAGSVAAIGIGEVLEMHPEHWDTFAEAVMTAKKIQQKLAAGEPIIIRDGQLYEIPAFVNGDWRMVGIIAHHCVQNGQYMVTEMSDPVVFGDIDLYEYEGIVKYIENNSELRVIEMTDLGWSVLKAGK